MPRFDVRLLALALPALLSCDDAAPIDRPAVYGELATNVIAPSYAALRTQSAALASAATSYCSDPSNATAFAALRAQLATTHRAYENTEAFELGLSPVVVQLLPQLLDTFPVLTTSGSPTYVEAILADATPIDLTAQAPTVQGFYTFEYLLYAEADESAAIALFTGNARRCEYVNALAARIADLADRAADVWDPPSATTFGASLASAGKPGSPYVTVGVATTDVLQRLHNTAHELGDMRLGVALGLLATGTAGPNPEGTPGHLAHWTKDDLLASLASIENLYYGRYGAADGRGLEDILVSRSAARAQQVTTQLAAARAAITAISVPVDQAVVDPQSAQSAEVLAAFDALKSLQTLIVSGVGPLLGVSSSAFETDSD